MLVFRYKQIGLTLVEMLVVLVMLAILAAVLTPRMTNYFAQANIKGAAEALYSNINLARTTAIESTDSVTITASSGSSWCYGLASGSISCTCSSPPSSSNCNLGVSQSTNFPNTTITFTNPTMTFTTSRGSTTNNSAIITGNSQSATVTINSMGIPSICSTGGTVGGYPAC